MCDFLHFVATQPVENKIVKHYLDDYNIWIHEVSNIVQNRVPTYYYYAILRNCSCDFVSDNPSKNNASEIQDLFKLSNKDGEIIVILLEDGGWESFDFKDLQILIDKYPKIKMDISDFFKIYPNKLKRKTSYRITESG